MFQQREHHKQVYIWEASTTVAEQVCTDLLPYLVVKREQAYIVRALSRINKKWDRRYKGGSGNYRLKTPEWKSCLQDFMVGRIRQLNQRGCGV